MNVVYGCLVGALVFAFLMMCLNFLLYFVTKEDENDPYKPDG